MSSSRDTPAPFLVLVEPGDLPHAAPRPQLMPPRVDGYVLEPDHARFVLHVGAGPDVALVPAVMKLGPDQCGWTVEGGAAYPWFKWLLGPGDALRAPSEPRASVHVAVCAWVAPQRYERTGTTRERRGYARLVVRLNGDVVYVWWLSSALASSAAVSLGKGIEAAKRWAEELVAWDMERMEMGR